MRVFNLVIFLHKFLKTCLKTRLSFLPVLEHLKGFTFILAIEIFWFKVYKQLHKLNLHNLLNFKALKHFDEDINEQSSNYHLTYIN